jgi:hypothetical protein
MITSQHENSVYTKVSELIDPITGQWDMDILHSLFNFLDAVRIMSIPINTQGFDDFIAWKATKNGNYNGATSLGRRRHSLRVQDLQQ